MGYFYFLKYHFYLINFITNFVLHSMNAPLNEYLNVALNEWKTQ